ncbi:acyl-lipid (9-3)-desaturase [Elaeis guineensis]|uniref:Acyl-lipid (9-3)-desaturase n=1 Tax=Elaeis guineensis var. tenera TaxID=51953 RepID=A0A6I9QVA4_ELAGV|nr:acyl-lipid (9-3)-desaturase [Elaeis guineensis]
MAMEGEKRRYITSAELRGHNTPGDLWISIQGKVYDVTRWVKDHPGGDIPLLNLAGQDVTDAFVAYHPATTWTLLDRFFIGYLADYRVSAVSKDYRRLVAEFARLGLFDKKGHGVLFSLIFMSFIFLVSVSGVLLSTDASVHLISGLLMGLLWIQSGFLGHDSGHYNVMISPGFNRLMQILSGNCLTGISIGWWKRNHNAHHIACNSLDFDPDVQHIPLFAVSSKFFNSLTSYFYERKLAFNSVARFLVSYQHWTFYPVMCVARVNLFAQSALLLLSKKKKVPGRWQEIVGCTIFWIWYPLLLSALPNWTERAMFVAANFAVTGIQHVQFCLNHFSASVYVGQPRGNDWFEKQTMGTLDILCSPWMDWFHGGLQFQVEHHLFPRLPRCHLRRISPYVEELCRKHRLPYTAASFWDANLRTIATLRTAALQARDLTKPVPKNLVWEAVNTHG